MSREAICAMHDSRPTVYLFTETYPYVGPDDPFLPAEVRVLARTLDVCLIPTAMGAEPVASDLGGVRVELGLSEYASRAGTRVLSLVQSLVTADLYRELARQRPLSLRPRAAATIGTRLSRALTVERWVRRHLLPIDRPAVVYSWWSAAYAVGLARALRSADTPLITRAHGYDLYAQQEVIGFVPFQSMLLDRVDRVMSASEAGTAYLRQRFPGRASKVSTAYLGIEGQPETSGASVDGVLRLVSCSAVSPVKRVELLARALSVVAERRPDLRFHWTHIGDGELSAHLAAYLESQPSLAGSWALTGFLEPASVKAWLMDNPVDLFVNVSASEGLPVSLMEAASFGIPMMATAVGGNPEIVDNTCGVLLRPDPTPGEIAQAVLDFAAVDSERLQALRTGSRERWEALFTADHNYEAFATMLVKAAVEH